MEKGGSKTRKPLNNFRFSNSKKTANSRTLLQFLKAQKSTKKKKFPSALETLKILFLHPLNNQTLFLYPMA